MSEYRTVSYMGKTTDLLGATPNGVQVQTIDFLTSVPQLAEHIDGWDIINAQIVPMGEYSYLVLFLQTSVS